MNTYTLVQINLIEINNEITINKDFIHLNPLRFQIASSQIGAKAEHLLSLLLFIFYIAL